MQLELNPLAVETIRFHLKANSGIAVKRARIAADVTIGQCKMGQQAEALVTVVH
ncbi:hypothetical protein [Paenibacillus sp. yr247]|uniref:hypothetical protein n=1 Tax=Paenibacillus sp. yr247 TaxID=1761880 RepID=UPI00158794E9|nr:hypothetical protein [Paenibacillus sp. yr247]